MKIEVETNQVDIIGEISSAFAYHHAVREEKFYLGHISVKRLSGLSDVIPLMISEKLLEKNKEYEGKRVDVQGSYRSYNKHDGNTRKLELVVFVQDIVILSDEECVEDFDSICLEGYICKEPIFRMTPKGRKITDIILAVNRPYKKSDYIPCIAWGKNAVYANDLKVGDHIRIQGRVQSREYVKVMSDAETEQRTAYEVSINQMYLLNESKSIENTKQISEI